jgi:hypothetical protein
VMYKFQSNRCTFGIWTWRSAPCAQTGLQKARDKVFPDSGHAGQSPAYACRVYATPAGLSGVPPLGDVISALTAASNREPASPE